MRVHSSIITERDLFAAVPQGCYLKQPSRHGSRSHGAAFECQLRGAEARHTRRPNSGTRGADWGDEYAATYDDWGHWIARLFDIDPDAKMTYYSDREDFHRQTDYRYASVAA
jgi:hypothetical protein